MKKEECRICRFHGNTVFSLRADGRWRCKRCVVEAVNKRRRLIKLKAIEYKGGSCSICGYSRCASSLVFHHVDSSEKDFNIGKKGETRSWNRVVKELDKCVLVCQNCHGEIHSGLIKKDDIKNETLHSKTHNILDKQNENVCLTCGKLLKNKTKSGLCRGCFKHKRKVENRPSLEHLIQDISDLGYCGTGRKYGVSDNAIRKWVKVIHTGG